MKQYSKFSYFLVIVVTTIIESPTVVPLLIQTTLEYPTNMAAMLLEYSVWVPKLLL